MSLIEADNISVIRQGKTILKSVSLAIGKRDFITIIGPNGAGKSMLLKCLLGFYSPSMGRIKRSQKLTIGYVPQRFNPDGSIPIISKRFLTLHKKANLAQTKAVIEQTGIGHLLEKPVSQLSGGELQRLLLARSLLDRPNLLVLDEPAQNLDVSGQLAFYKLLEQIYQKHHLSILMVSHDLHMVMASTQKVVCLFEHICCSGTPQSVTKDPAFAALFGADMANMMAIYQHKHQHEHH